VACSKKHKLYRDPTAFVKRSKFMTKGGMNRDFACLTGVERGIKRPTLVEEEDGMGILEGRIGHRGRWSWRGLGIGRGMIGA